MSIELWPIVGRAQLLQAFRPGEPAGREAPFRTLRAHRWATGGVSIVTRSSRHASGRLTVFSVLNLAAARLARDGEALGARRLSSAAAQVEQSAAFSSLKALLSGRPLDEVAAVISGDVSRRSAPEVLDALRAVARVTHHAVARPTARRVHEGVLTGQILEARGEGLVVRSASGTTNLVPRWLGRAAHREQVGDHLALITDRLQTNQLVVQALPAIELTHRPSPLGRNAAVTRLTAADARLLMGRPMHPEPLVPVVIEP